MPFLNQQKGENDRRKYFMINLHERMLPTSAGVEPATSWSPVRRRIQLSHRGRQSSVGDALALAFRCERFCLASLILFASYSPPPLLMRPQIDMYYECSTHMANNYINNGRTHRQRRNFRVSMNFVAMVLKQ